MPDACNNPQRRAWLQKAALLAMMPSILVSGCGEAESPMGQAADPTPFSARFAIPGQGGVRLDFQNDASFIVTPDFGPGSTIAYDGEIYFHLAPSIASVGRSRLLWVGALAPRDRNFSAKTVALEPADLPRSQVDLWKANVPIFRVRSPDDASSSAEASFRLQPPPTGDIWVARIPTLASAQYAVGVQMRDGMDMSFCGDVVARLVSTWPESLTAHGLAVLLHASGVQLAGPIEPMTNSIALPTGVEVEDFRLRRR